MSFTKVVEDFTCGHCGAKVRGTGYTNHCPKCLWSEHVDIEPGDRAEKCGGMMEPVGVEGSSPEYRIVHVCQTCGAVRRVDAARDDDPQAIVALARSA
jgi:hypothetical protein